MLIVIMLSVAILSVIMLSVAMPVRRQLFKAATHRNSNSPNAHKGGNSSNLHTSGSFIENVGIDSFFDECRFLTCM
jgi:hypothetical protein